MRSCVRLFRKNPVKNDDVLQKHVKAEFRREYMLILDSKTRWNSLVDMIKRFVKLKKSIKMSLIELSSDIHFSDEEFNELEDLIAALEPVKIGTEALCRRDATLISADEVTKFIYQQLNMQTSSFSKELLASFINRMNQRRNVEVMALLLYLKKS